MHEDASSNVTIGVSSPSEPPHTSANDRAEVTAPRKPNCESASRALVCHTRQDSLSALSAPAGLMPVTVSRSTGLSATTCTQLSEKSLYRCPWYFRNSSEANFSGCSPR